MERLLWVIFVWQLVKCAAPYIAGFIGAAVIVSMIGSVLPGRLLFLLFIAIACGLAQGLEGAIKSRGDGGDRD